MNRRLSGYIYLEEDVAYVPTELSRFSLSYGILRFLFYTLEGAGGPVGETGICGNSMRLHGLLAISVLMLRRLLHASGAVSARAGAARYPTTWLLHIARGCYHGGLACRETDRLTVIWVVIAGTRSGAKSVRARA